MRIPRSTVGQAFYQTKLREDVAKKRPLEVRKKPLRLNSKMPSVKEPQPNRTQTVKQWMSWNIVKINIAITWQLVESNSRV